MKLFSSTDWNLLVFHSKKNSFNKTNSFISQFWIFPFIKLNIRYHHQHHPLLSILDLTQTSLCILRIFSTFTQKSLEFLSSKNDNFFSHSARTMHNLFAPIQPFIICLCRINPNSFHSFCFGFILCHFLHFKFLI